MSKYQELKEAASGEILPWFGGTSEECMAYCKSATEKQEAIESLHAFERGAAELIEAANKRIAELETQNLELTTSLRRVIELYKCAAQYTTVWSEDIIATALDALAKSDQAIALTKEIKQ